MIAPAYRRDQLWQPARRTIDPYVAIGLAFGFVIALNVVALPSHTCALRETPTDRARMVVAKLVYESFPDWRMNHTGCPHRLSDLLPDTHLDPWGHAMHYTCDPRLARGGQFAVISAGEDGVFGTSDDIEDQQ